MVEGGVAVTIRVIEESAWWWAAVYGDGMPIHESTPPQPGFYKRRLVPRGPFYPAHIWIVRDVDDETDELMADEVFGCEVNGQPADAWEEWMYLCKHPITREEYETMMEITHAAE